MLPSGKGLRARKLRPVAWHENGTTDVGVVVDSMVSTEVMVAVSVVVVVTVMDSTSVCVDETVAVTETTSVCVDDSVDHVIVAVVLAYCVTVSVTASTVIVEVSTPICWQADTYLLHEAQAVAAYSGTSGDAVCRAIKPRAFPGLP